MNETKPKRKSHLFRQTSQTRGVRVRQMGKSSIKNTQRLFNQRQYSFQAPARESSANRL